MHFIHLTYSMPDLISKASGGKITTLEELKVEWIGRTLLSLLNSLDNPLRQRLFLESSFGEAPWSAASPVNLRTGTSNETLHQRSPMGSAQLRSVTAYVWFGLPIVCGERKYGMGMPLDRAHASQFV